MNKHAKILIVDDDANHIITLSGILKAKGYAPLAAQTVEQALEAAKLHVPVVALIDLKLHEKADTGLMRQIRQLSPQTECIVVTGFASKATAIDAINVGAFGYLQKPYDPNQLLLTIQRAIEKIEAQEALRQSEEKYKSLIDNIPVVTWISDATGKTHFISSNVEKVFGYSSDEICSAGPEIWLGRVHLDDLPSVKAKYEAFLAGGEKYDIEYRIQRKDGDWIWLHDYSVKKLTENGVALAYGVFMDITEKKQLEANLLRAQRLESIGRLAGGIAHDLNNVLTPVLLSVEMLREQVQDATLQQILDTVESSAIRGTNIIRQLLTFARGSGGEKLPTNLRYLVKEMGKIINETFPKSIRLTLETPEQIWDIKGDSTQLHQVLMNLCLNARDAMPNDGRLKIVLENVQLDEHSAAMVPSANAGPYVLLQVSDTGAGIKPEDLNRIFDPFFTTKGPEHGTGLGLATVLGIVKAHSGFILVESQIAKGAIFKVYLPAETKKAEPMLPQEAVQLPKGQGELILVVDDEESIRNVTSAALDKNGYRTLSAADGAEAVLLYCQNKDQVRLVITDMLMPIMTGPALIHAIQKINPDIRIIAVSGLGSRDKLKDLPKVGAHAYLKKPYTYETLLKTVRDVLQQPIGQIVEIGELL